MGHPPMKTQLMLKTWCRLSAMILSMFVVAYAQDLGGGDACTLFFSGVLFPPLEGQVNTRGTPVIFGKDFEVPQLQMRFVDPKSGEPITPRVVSVHYYWLWLEYPYPEHDWGAWSDAEDSVKCSTGGDNELVVPTRTIRPRGWYDGKYTRFPYTLTGSKKPRFDGLEIKIEFGECAPYLIVKERDLAKYKNRTAVLKLPCAGYPEVTFEDLAK